MFPIVTATAIILCVGVKMSRKVINVVWNSEERIDELLVTNQNRLADRFSPLHDFSTSRDYHTRIILNGNKSDEHKKIEIRCYSNKDNIPQEARNTAIVAADYKSLSSKLDEVINPQSALGKKAGDEWEIDPEDEGDFKEAKTGFVTSSAQAALHTLRENVSHALTPPQSRSPAAEPKSPTPVPTATSPVASATASASSATTKEKKDSAPMAALKSFLSLFEKNPSKAVSESPVERKREEGEMETKQHLR